MFEPDSFQEIEKVYDTIAIKFLKLAHSDNDLNGQCLNSPYYVKYGGELYRGVVAAISSTGMRLSGLTLIMVNHVPISQKGVSMRKYQVKDLPIGYIFVYMNKMYSVVSLENEYGMTSVKEIAHFNANDEMAGWYFEEKLPEEFHGDVDVWSIFS